MFDVLILIIGIGGVVLIGINVLLETLNKLNKNHKVFTTLNLTGSIALYTYSLYNHVWLFVILNFFLILVGAYTFAKAFNDCCKELKET